MPVNQQAWAAGREAGDRSMRLADRKSWNREDLRRAAMEFDRKMDPPRSKPSKKRESSMAVGA